MPVEQAGETAPRGLGGSFVPVFSAGCRAHLIGDERVLVLGPQRRLLLRGRAHASVVALIDGRSSDGQIVSALAGRLSPAVIQLALARLADRGLIVHAAPDSVGPPPVRPQLCGDVLAQTVLPRPSELRCVGIGVEGSIVARLATAVAENVAGSDRGESRRNSTSDVVTAPGLMVAVVDDYLRPALDQLADRCRADGCGLLPIRGAGPEWWLGPYCDGAGAGPMWRLFGQRLRANRRDDVDSLRLGATFPLYGEPEPEPEPEASDAVAEGVAHAAEIIERTLRGDPPASIVDAVCVLDRRHGSSTTHRIAVVADPPARRCPGFGQRLPVLRLTRDRSHADGDGRRSRSPEATFARMAPLISPITGVVAGLERLPAPAGTHVYAASGTLEWPVPDTGDGRPTFRRGALGKGLSDVQARVSCVGEAIELVSASFTGDEPRRRARWREVHEIAIHPHELLLISDAQRAEAARHPVNAAWDGVPAPLDERHAIEWVPLHSLGSGGTRWLPAAYCYLDYADPDYPAPPYSVANANGCATGNTLEEAILQGLLELIERDACALWWYSRARRPGIDLDSFGDPRLTAIRDAHAALGRTLAVLDLRCDTGVPVVAAVACDLADGTPLATGRGCHLDPATAILDAVTELSQVSAVGGPVDHPPVKGATAAARPHLLPDRSAAVQASDLPPTPGIDVCEAIESCVQMLARLGHEALVLDTTRPDIGFPSVRVIVPGLRPLLRRLAPGRLYDVPVALGWVSGKLREDELNPEAFWS